MKWTDDWTPNGFSKPTLILGEMLEGKIDGAVGNALMKHMSAWGEYRISIKQSAEQATRTGRTNLFIHCGDSLGSAGCIDLSLGMNIFVHYLQKEHPKASNFWIPFRVG